jgi:hypothetical protein
MTHQNVTVGKTANGILCERDNTQVFKDVMCFQNVIRFHILLNIISFAAIRKVLPFCANSHEILKILNIRIYRLLTPNFTQLEQFACKICIKVNLCAKEKYRFSWDTLNNAVS